MALSTLLLKDRNRMTINTALVIDATVSESPSYTAQATQNPVEEGADIVDHIILKPLTLSVEGFVSENPIDLSNSIASQALSLGAGLIPGAASQVATALNGSSTLKAVAGIGGAFLAGTLNANVFSKSKNPAEDARKELVKIFDDRVLSNIVTGQGITYSNLAMTSLEFPRNPSQGKGLRFTARFEQVRTVSSKTVKIESIPKDSLQRAAEKQNQGIQSAKAVDAETAKQSSILYQAGKSVGFISGR